VSPPPHPAIFPAFVVGGGAFIAAYYQYLKSQRRPIVYRPSTLREKYEADTEVLINWASERGANVDHLIVGKSQEGHRGLFVKRRIRKDNVVLFLPNNCKLDAECIYDSPSVVSAFNRNGSYGDAARHFLNERLHLQNTALALCLLDEERKGTSSAFEAYVQTLPRDILPVLNGDRRTDLPPPVQSEVQELLHHAETAFDHISSSIPFSKEQFLWAYSMVTSRCFNDASIMTLLANTRNVDTGNPFMSSFLPLIDMANHADEPNVKFERSDRYVRFVALEDLEAHDEICFDYHPSFRHTESFWVYYGF